MFEIEDFEEDVYACLDKKSNTENCIFLYNDITNTQLCAKEGAVLLKVCSYWYIVYVDSDMCSGTKIDYSDLDIDTIGINSIYRRKIREFEIDNILD